jgi:hypothetical protein
VPNVEPGSKGLELHKKSLRNISNIEDTVGDLVEFLLLSLSYKA